MRLKFALLILFAAVFVYELSHRTAFAAEVKRPVEWEKIVEAAKKEGKIVIAIPPAAALRKEMEITLKHKLGLEAELVPNPGPRNASRIAAEQKAGVRYFDALIVGTGTAVTWLMTACLNPSNRSWSYPKSKTPSSGEAVMSGKTT